MHNTEQWQDAIRLIYQIDERTKLLIDRDLISRGELAMAIEPIKNITYGLVAIIVVAVISALVKNVMKK